jgi:hypothetical protein
VLNSIALFNCRDGSYIMLKERKNVNGMYSYLNLGFILPSLCGRERRVLNWAVMYDVRLGETGLIGQVGPHLIVASVDPRSKRKESRQ